MSGLIQQYNGKPVLHGFDLTLDCGSLGLLGPNGAGKTTLLRTLATILPPAGGTLSVNGRRIESEMDARLARREIGYLAQDLEFIPHFTVRDFVYYIAWLREVPTPTIDQSVLASISALGLEDHSRSKLKSLSGGTLRRVGIATAIVGTPKLILLDEPTVGLDPKQRLEFRALMRKVQLNSVVILSTHLVEDVAALCDKVAVMDDGRFAFLGSPADLAEIAGETDVGETPLERGYMAVMENLRTIL
ncbi:MAG: ATP-binding cassette domain-containing protein [Thermobispora bispora]|nr:ATP-binding cassette domain-containing protein [Thermobispora bispora]